MRERTESDFKAVTEDLARLGQKYLEAGRELINDWRMQMNRNRGQQGRDWQHEPRSRPEPRDRDFDRTSLRTGPNAQRATGSAYGKQWSGEDDRNQDDARRYRAAYGGQAEEPTGSAYERGYADRPSYTGAHARGGYETGYGGPGGYGARSGYESGYGGEEFRSGYGGSDYQDERYAASYVEPDASRASGIRSYERGYRGLGPKDYTRSDERIREDLCERLSEADDIDASEITVAVRDGVATLQGEVENRWMKYRAEDLADSCAGVKDVQNSLRIQRQTAAQSRYSPTGKSQQRAQRDYERGTQQRESVSPDDRAESSKH